MFFRLLTLPRFSLSAFVEGRGRMSRCLDLTFGFRALNAWAVSQSRRILMLLGNLTPLDQAVDEYYRRAFADVLTLKPPHCSRTQLPLFPIAGF
jgi:hypothetical protein